MTLRALALAAVAAGCCTACAPATLLTYRDDQPPTVTLPATQAGVRDERVEFAALFARELNASSANGHSDVTRWLHGVGVAGSPSTLHAARRDATFATRAPTTAVLIVPGLFGDCVGAQSVPFGDGVMRTLPVDPAAAYRQYADLGLREIRLLPVPGRASAAANARPLAEAVLAEAQRHDLDRLVLFGYSKGVSDLLEALTLLQRAGGVPAKVTAVVSVAGAVMGTPLADRYRQAYEALSPHVTPLDCTPSQGEELASLTRHESIERLAAHPLPPGIAYYSVVAHAPVDEMAPPLRVTSRWLASIDPRNDGQLLATDAVLPGGTLLAEARADHWDVALPRERHPNPIVRALTSGRAYPREALFRAIVRRVVGAD